MLRKLIAIVIAAGVALAPAAARGAYSSPYSVDVGALIMAAAEPATVELPDGVPQVTTLEEGERAPFGGTLLNPAAAATISVERENSAAKCQIEVDRAVAVAEAEKQLEVDNLRAELKSAVARTQLEELTRKRQVDALSQDLERAQKQASGGKWNAAWFAGGVAAGVLVIIAGAFAVRGVREANIQ